MSKTDIDAEKTTAFANRHLTLSAVRLNGTDAKILRASAVAVATKDGTLDFNDFALLIEMPKDTEAKDGKIHAELVIDVR